MSGLACFIWIDNQIYALKTLRSGPVGACENIDNVIIVTSILRLVVQYSRYLVLPSGTDGVVSPDNSRWKIISFEVCGRCSAPTTVIGRKMSGSASGLYGMLSGFSGGRVIQWYSPFFDAISGQPGFALTLPS